MLKRGALKRLGLYKHHPFYLAWCNMKTRCDNPKSTQWLWYGGRGIKYCLVWKNFENFYIDMWPEWQPGLVLDRIDGDTDYSKGNCRWISRLDSSRNRSSTIISVEVAGAVRLLYQTGKYTQQQLAERFGLLQPSISAIILDKSWR